MATGKEQKSKDPKPKDQAPKEQKPKEPKTKDQKPKEQKHKEQAPKTDDKGLLETAAEAIGSTLGTIAVKTGLAHPEGRISQKIGKLPKKNKSRMPRKLKKRARKVRGADGSASAQ